MATSVRTDTILEVKNVSVDYNAANGTVHAVDNVNFTLGRGEIMGLAGEIPSLIHPPSGCRFHPRCPHAMPVCREHFPGRTDLGGGHWTHCFLYGDGETQAENTDPLTCIPY